MAADDKNWWERNVEDEMAAQKDRERAALGDNPIEVAKHDIITGAEKGAYNFGKGMVVGVVDLAIVASKVVTFDGPTYGKIWDAAKWVATEGFTAYFGSDAEKKAQNDRAEAAVRAMAGQLRDTLNKEWDEATRTGKRTELLSKWATEGILNIASFFVGAGEVKAAAGAAKGAEALGAVEVLANVTAKCPKLAAAEEAAQAAKLARAAEEAAAIAKGKALATASALEHAGMTEAAANRVLAIAKEENAIIKFRPTNKESLKWIEQGYPAKPEMIKAKTIVAEDIALGAPEGKEGLVWHKEPIKPTGDNPELMKRYDKRLKEFEQNDKKMQELVKEGKISIAEDGTVIDPKTGKPFTGDHDIYEVTRADGQPMSPEQRSRIQAELESDPVRAQHGAHVEWETTTPKDQAIKDGIIDGHKETTSGGKPGEALVIFGPDGATTGYAP